MDKALTVCTVSVLMPVYNAGEFLRLAIESILNQTFSDFEFIIFNDGSTDESSKIVRSYKDPRIKFYDYSQNSGYVIHLNTGIEIARGKYIARMDADDIAHPQRLEKQVSFLEKHPEIGVLGGWLQTIEDVPTLFKYPESNGEILMKMMQDNPMGHPVVTMRRDILIENKIRYDNSYVPAEDYKMWSLLTDVTKLANLQEVLLYYRKHEGQISTRKAQLQRHNILKTQFEFLSSLCPDNGFDFETYCKLKEIRYEAGIDFLEKAGYWIQSLLQENDRKHKLPIEPFRKALLWEWYCVCNYYNQKGGNSWKSFYSFHPYKKSFHSFYHTLRLFLQNFNR